MTDPNPNNQAKPGSPIPVPTGTPVPSSPQVQQPQPQVVQQVVQPQPAQPQVVQPIQQQAIAQQPQVNQVVQQPVYQQQRTVLSQQPAQKQVMRPVPPQTVIPLTPRTLRKPPSPRRVLYWVLGCFGCSILLFVLFVLLFVAQTSANGENALARSLGVDTATFINSLITIVNVLFGFFSIILFIIGIVGIFRTAMARRDDKEARKKGLTLAGAAGLLLTFMVFVWVGIYLFLSSKKVIVPKTTQQAVIVTDPVNTFGLVAPITIKFDGTKLPIDTKKYQLVSFLWDFGDGESSTVQSPSHNYKNMGKNNGRFDVSVKVGLRDQTSGQETSQTYTTIVTISNVKLNAEFTANPLQGPAPLRVSFDASASSAPAGEIQSYEWDYTNSNTFKGDTGVTVEHTFDQVGKYRVSLRITDNTGQYTTVSKEISVLGPNLPTATLSIPTTDGNYYVGMQYTFNGDQSSSPTGKIMGYSWDFGDQTPKASTRTATHKYQAAGDYVVALTVTDDKGVQNQSTQKITVENPVGAPIAVMTTIPAEIKKGDGYIQGTVPFEVTFDGSSSKEENGQVIDYKWDFDGDGKVDNAGKQVKYVYNAAGNYNATLTVYDAQNKSTTTTFVIKVAEQGIQARISATPVEGVVPLTVNFDASGSSYPSGQIVSYQWDFGDGTPLRIDVSKVTYKYTQIGTFTAKVTAIASDGVKSTANIQVNVRPVPLKACFEAGVTQGAAPLTVDFDPRCSTGTVAKYTWDFADGQTSRARKPSHTFASPGSYEVKLEVADNQNVIDTYSVNILVTGTVGP